MQVTEMILEMEKHGDMEITTPSGEYLNSVSTGLPTSYHTRGIWSIEVSRNLFHSEYFEKITITMHARSFEKMVQAAYTRWKSLEVS